MTNSPTLDELERLNRSLIARQTATAEILETINASPGDLGPVFDKILEQSLLLCGAAMGSVSTIQDGMITRRATRGLPGERDAGTNEVVTPNGPAGRMIATKRVVHVLDYRDEPIYGVDPGATAFADLVGGRTIVLVPLLQNTEVLGVIAAFRTEVRAFTDDEIALLETFAHQAVIAIENARLLNELKARTAELAARNSDFSEQITHQSATIDVLKAMSASPADPQPVFDQIVQRAQKICGATASELITWDGALMHHRALHTSNDRAVWQPYLDTYPRLPNPEGVTGLAVYQQRISHISDNHIAPGFNAASYATGMRSVLTIPLLRDGATIGLLSLEDEAPGGFSDSQVALLKTFAEQAVIAISSAETFRALETRTAELTNSVASAEAALSDLKRAQDRLVQSEKMASLGQLTAGIAHEIKNPLNFVNNFSDLSIELIDELQEILVPAPLADATRSEVDDLTTLIKSNLGKVVQHGRRADSIVKNMLLHSRASGGDMREIDLNATVEEALNLAYHGARAEKPGFNITLERNFDPAAGTVALYPQEFTRVLLNMFSNGFYATTKKTSDPGFEPTLTVITEGRPDAVIIRIRDNGTGIHDSARARLFEPFFTTKPAGEGTGLGLSLSHDIIVKQHNGSIAMDSVEGSHTEFTITIPRASTGAAP